MKKISVELRSQYVLGYKPSNLIRDGRWRRIKVKLVPPEAPLHFRSTPALALFTHLVNPSWGVLQSLQSPRQSVAWL